MTETPQHDNEPQHNEPQPQSLNMFPALLSLFCPGLGQFIQGRPVFIGHVSLYVIALFFLYAIIGDNFEYWRVNGNDFIRIINRDGIVFCAIHLVFPFLTILLSVLDAATWKKGQRPPLAKFAPRLGMALAGCIFVIGILSIQPAKEGARRMQCSNNLKQIALGFHNYHDAYKCFPPAYTVDENGKPLHSWRVLILPFMDQRQLYEQIRLDEPWDSEYNRQFHDEYISAFYCPTANRRNNIVTDFLPKMETSEKCYYSAVIGPETIFSGSKATTLGDISDGTPNTILVVERLLPVCWMDPNNKIGFYTACSGVNRNFYGISSAHGKQGANIVAADGSSHFLSDTINPETLRALLTKSGEENVIMP